MTKKTLTKSHNYYLYAFGSPMVYFNRLRYFHLSLFLGWVGGWLVFAETKNQQGLINYVVLSFETEICLKIRGTGRKSFKD